MNAIEKELFILNEVKTQTINSIYKIMQGRIDLIDPNIKVTLYTSVNRIAVHFKTYVFEFTYYYHNNLLYLRGHGKTNTYGYGYRYTKEQQIEREQSYTYVRNVIKKCLEQEN